MSSTLRLAFIFVALFAGCGGNAPIGHADADDVRGGGDDGAAGARFDAASDAAAGAPSDAASEDAARPGSSCGSATPLPGGATGFEACSAGYVRRVSPGTCPSSVPRAAAVAHANAAVDQCAHDSDCADSGALGFCGPREGGTANVCIRGCVTDADCGAGRICLCGDPAGRCVSATCAQASDCPAGRDCASGVAHPLCQSTTFACQSPGECATDSDCMGVFVNAAFCVLRDGHRSCSTEQCTTP
jgi:hypothetical protein